MEDWKREDKSFITRNVAIYQSGAYDTGAYERRFAALISSCINIGKQYSHIAAGHSL